MNIAFVLLTHNPDEPAGIERSIDALAQGLRDLGHRVLTVAAGPATREDGGDLLRLTTLDLPRPILVDEVLRLIADPGPVRREVTRLLSEHRVDLVCWVDAVAGLGYLNPAPPGVRTALMVHFLRTDAPMTESLGHRPDAVLTVSEYMIEEAARMGLDSGRWHALPNALPGCAAPPCPAQREQLRLTGPVRLLSRADPQKGVAELLRGYPRRGLGRRVQIVLASAAFEFWPGMQETVLEECGELARGLPEVELLPALPWQEVQPFLAGAAATLIGSVRPETFGNVAAEALSVGTPVVGYDLGHLSALTEGAGRMVRVEEGPERLWGRLAGLLGDRHAYHEAALRGPAQVRGNTPVAVAEAFLRATAPQPA